MIFERSNKVKRIVGLVIFVSVLLASCSNDKVQDKEEENKLPSQKEVSFSYEGKNFKIIPFYEEVLEYTDYVKKNPSESNPGAYKEKVLEPLKEKSTLNLHLEYPFKASTEVEKFEKNTIQLLQKQEQINELIKEALIKSSEHLPGGDKNVYIMPVRPEDNLVINNMEGVSGVTYNEKDIFIQIDPAFSEDTLKYVVAHEYHHAINILANGEMVIYTILDRILFEGKADSFAHIIYPEISAPWTEPLPEETAVIVLEELRKNADSTSIKIYMDFFNGNSAKGIPLWSNYKIGYEITQSYIENNPDTTISKWTRLPSKDLLQNCEYNNLLK
jgi:uncharacterized protein YjaZ